MSEKLSRRTFNTSLISTGAVVSLASLQSASRILGANDRIRTGFIGTGNRGTQLLRAFMEHKDCRIAALCDVHGQSLRQAAELVGTDVPQYKDFRHMLDRETLDAVVIGTPDHWHAIQFIMCADAKKDIYVEKPLSLTIHEGRRMVEAARRNNIVSQVGSQRRSVPHWMGAAELMQSGTIGHITTARFFRVSNMFPKGMGNPPDTDPPPELDWDMWLGPARKVPYNENKCLYKFRWFSEYSSQTSNWGAHYLDLTHWFLNEDAPVTITALGGNYTVPDNRDIPDTLHILYEYPSGMIASFGLYEASSGSCIVEKALIEMRGTDGTFYGHDRGYKIAPIRNGQFQDRAIPVEAQEVTADGRNANATVLHARNFLDCVKSRQRCNADIEIGHRAATACHLGNIAYKTRSVIVWDPKKERITNDWSFNKHLHYEYRAPWKLG